MSFRQFFTKSGMCKIHQKKLRRIFMHGMIVCYCDECIQKIRESKKITPSPNMENDQFYKVFSNKKNEVSPS